MLGRDTRGVLRFHHYAIEDDGYHPPRGSFVVQHHQLFLADPADQMSCESRFAARFHPPLTWPVALRHFTFVILDWEIRSEIMNRSLLTLMIAAAVIIQSRFLGNGGAHISTIKNLTLSRAFYSQYRLVFSNGTTGLYNARRRKLKIFFKQLDTFPRTVRRRDEIKLRLQRLEVIFVD